MRFESGLSAVVEFQRIVDHRSIVLVDPMDAMARLQRARALALSGDTVKAKSAYHDLLTLWKNADPRFRFSRKQGQNMRNFRKLRTVTSQFGFAGRSALPVSY